MCGHTEAYELLARARRKWPDQPHKVERLMRDFAAAEMKRQAIMAKVGMVPRHTVTQDTVAVMLNPPPAESVFGVAAVTDISAHHMNRPPA